MKYCVKSSKDYELLERLLHKIAYIDHHTHSCPCTYQLVDDTRHRGIIYEDDWRVFISATAKDGVSHYEVTRKRNKYTGIAEGMSAISLRFSVPVEYSKQYDAVRQEVQQIREKRKPFIKHLKPHWNTLPQTWLIDEFIRINKTPEDLLKVWTNVMQINKKYPKVGMGSILKRYRENKWNPDAWLDMYTWAQNVSSWL